HLKSKPTMKELPADFADALERALVIASSESKPTVINVVKGMLKMLTEAPEGQIKENLELKGHPDVEAKVYAGRLARSIKICDKIAFLDNCTVLERAPDVFQLVSNMN
ncbi:hypothetical protein GP486_008673, partial [Trichoglossum hirsutum]